MCEAWLAVSSIVRHLFESIVVFRCAYCVPIAVGQTIIAADSALQNHVIYVTLVHDIRGGGGTTCVRLLWRSYLIIALCRHGNCSLAGPIPVYVTPCIIQHLH